MRSSTSNARRTTRTKAEPAAERERPGPAQEAPEVWRELGRRALVTGDPGEALWYLRRAVEDRGEHPVAWQLLGRCFEELGDEERAKRCYRLAARQALRQNGAEEMLKNIPQTLFWDCLDNPDS